MTYYAAELLLRPKKIRRYIFWGNSETLLIFINRTMIIYLHLIIRHSKNVLRYLISLEYKAGVNCNGVIFQVELNVISRITWCHIL